MIYSGDKYLHSNQYLFDYVPLDFFNEKFKNQKYNTYRSFLENVDEVFAYKLNELYIIEKENIKNIKDNYNERVEPIKDKINFVLSNLDALANLFKNNSKYEITEEGFIVKKKYLDLIWHSQEKKSKFLINFREILKVIKELNQDKYKHKYFRNYQFGANFHSVNFVNLFEYKEGLSNFVMECRNIFSELYPEEYQHFYVRGAGSNGTEREFWAHLGRGNSSFFYFVIPSKIYTNDLEDKQIKFEKEILPFLENRIRKFEREKQASSTYSFVYVLSNKSYPNTYKIGSTSGTPKDRAAELATTGVLHPFKVEFQIKMKDAEYYEINTHKILNKYRVKNNKEFFELELDKIKDCLQQVSILSEKGQKKVALADLKKKIKLR